MPLLETKGAGSAQGFGLSLGGEEAVYVEDVFSTYLYTGNGSTQTITNGIDLAGEGGLTWIKGRSGATDHQLFDTVRGATKELISRSTAAEATDADTLTAFNSDGFSLGADSNTNTNAATYASWTFRKQAKFFDVVTYTGDGTNNTRQINHNLEQSVGMVIIKRTDSSSEWGVWHRGDGTTDRTGLSLNRTGASVASGTANRFTSTWFDPSGVYNALTTQMNLNGATYVAYLFAHNAGGFGLTGTDNVISCGSFSHTNGTTTEINLGWEAQYVLVKRTDAVGSWFVVDVMRGMTTDQADPYLVPTTSAAEASYKIASARATGWAYGSGQPTSVNIYIAIRRGPMKVPESGTEVLGLSARSGTGANATVSGGQIADAALIKNRGSTVGDLFAARLTGTGYMETSSTAAEVAAGTTILQANPWDVMDGVKVGTTSTITNASGNTFINYLFRRAPGFFDVVCYTGTGSNITLNHNLKAVPQLMIVKTRNNTGSWHVYSVTAGPTFALTLNNGNGAGGGNGVLWQSTNPTDSVFYVGGNTGGNSVDAVTYVAYLFATLAGVSKVGSYTGTGTTQVINCGFTAGARFVLIKRTDSTGDWYVWDSARGIVAGNDPYLLLNSTAAEVTNTDYVDTAATGFEISSTAPAAINASGGTFIFLAIA